MAAVPTMGFQLSRPMTATVYVTNVGDYDTFIDATRSAGFVVGPQDWHYMKYGIKINFESTDHASAFLSAVRELRIGESKVVARASERSSLMVQSSTRILWPVPTIRNIQVAFCDTYAAAGQRAQDLQPRLLLNDILGDEREIYYDDDSDTDSSDAKVEDADTALKMESEDMLKMEHSDEVKREIKSESKRAFKEEHSDDTKDVDMARTSTLISLPVRVGLIRRPEDSYCW